MKNSKKYEKYVDQSTRSRRRQFLFAVRLLVLLVMITTILASFAVPASAADPFRGSGTFDFKYLLTLSTHPSSSQPSDLTNPLPADFSWSSKEYLYITDNLLTLEIERYTPSFNFTFDAEEMYESDFADFPFVSCNKECVAVVNGQNIYVPAGENIVDYVKSQGALTGISNIRRYSTNLDGTSGPHYYDFVLNPDGVSYQFEGGIRSVFDVIATWIGNTFSQLSRIFFADGSLTVVGTLGVASLAIGVILLLLSIFSRFLRFGG